MITCFKCGKDVAEGSMFCNFCGEKVLKNDTDCNSTDENTIISEQLDMCAPETSNVGTDIEEQHLPMQRKGIKKAIFISVAAILIITLTGVGIWYYFHKGAEKYYAQNFTTTTLDILLQTYSCEVMCETLSKTWYDAIYSDYKDFNDELAKQIKSWEADGTIKKLEDAKSKLEENMKKLGFVK